MIEAIEFRRAKRPDARPISELIGSLAHHRSLILDEPASEAFLAGFAAATLTRHLADPRFGYMVALVDDDLAGVLGIRDGNLINHFFVAERFQRRGVGRALWEAAQRLQMVESGKGPVSVRSSMSAVAVYERFGFIPTGPMVHEHGVMYVPMVLAV